MCGAIFEEIQFYDAGAPVCHVRNATPNAESLAPYVQWKNQGRHCVLHAIDGMSSEEVLEHVLRVMVRNFR